MKCELCGRECSTYRALATHLRYKHSDITCQDYYDKFFLKDNNDKCQECGKKCNFENLNKGYYHFCSKSCKSKHMSKNKTCIFGTEEGKQKIRETLLKRYGVTHSSLIPGINEKRNQTHIIKTGYSLWNDPNLIKNRQNLNFKEIYRKYKEKTGYDNPNLNPEVRSKMSKKYKYNDILFDSSWEIAYYIWLKDNNIEFTFHENESLEYEFDGKKYHYIPDFKTKEGYIEIKGNHLLRYMQVTNTKEYAKYKCMIDNKVSIISYKEIKPILEYIQSKYGKDYLQSFRYEK